MVDMANRPDVKMRLSGGTMHINAEESTTNDHVIKLVA